MPLSPLPEFIDVSVAELSLTLRRPTVVDIPALIEACQDPEIPRWTTVPSPYGEAEARAFVDRSDLWWSESMLQRNYMLASESGALFGMFGLVRVRGDDEAGEVGYWLASGARGKGVATAALRALTKAVLLAGYYRVEAEVLVGNSASQHLLERCGYRHEGTFRSVGWHGAEPNRHRIDVHAYSILPDDPAAQELLS